MSRVVISPVKKFSGTVTLSDPLTLPQSWAFADAITAAQELTESVEVDGRTVREFKSGMDSARFNFAILPGALKCVEKWELENFPAHPTPDSFPATPKSAHVASNELIAWLINQIVALYQDTDSVPNA